MDNPAAPAESLNVEQLLHLHTLTKDVAKVCQKQLRGYLDTLALLFRPRRMLGDAMEGAERESVGGSDRTLAELRDLYRKVALRPFDLRPELSLPLESVSTQMHLHFTKFPVIADLLAGLRYRIEVRQSPETGDLPLVTVSAPFSTLRPPDSLVT